MMFSCDAGVTDLSGSDSAALSNNNNPKAAVSRRDKKIVCDVRTNAQEIFKLIRSTEKSKELTTKLRSWRKRKSARNDLSNLCKSAIVVDETSDSSARSLLRAEDDCEFDGHEWEKFYHDFNMEQILENCLPRSPENSNKDAYSLDSPFTDFSDNCYEESECVSKQENGCQSVTEESEKNTSSSSFHGKFLNSLYKKLRNQESRIKDLSEENVKLRKTVQQLQANQTKISQDVVTDKVYEVLNELFTVDEIYILSNLNERKRKLLGSTSDRVPLKKKTFKTCESS